jgi:hypothetical protein
MQLVDLLAAVEELVKLVEIGDDVVDGDVAAYALSEVVDSLLVLGPVDLVGVLGSLPDGVGI